MTQHTTASPHSKILLGIGLGLVIAALLILVGFGVWLSSGGSMFSLSASADAILFIDVPGRIAIDSTLQVDGPAPVPVSVGTHVLSFFDISSKTPLETSVKQDEFRYISHPLQSRYSYANTSHGTLSVSAFPPDTMIEISDCTPTDSKYPVKCKSTHTLSAELSPGTYMIRYTNPFLGEATEQFTIAANSTLHREHNYITTIDQWNTWRQEHGTVIEQNYPRYYRGYGLGGAFSLPFRATGEVVDELFN